MLPPTQWAFTEFLLQINQYCSFVLVCSIALILALSFIAKEAINWMKLFLYPTQIRYSDSGEKHVLIISVKQARLYVELRESSQCLSFHLSYIFLRRREQITCSNNSQLRTESVQGIQDHGSHENQIHPSG
jgi:hypothetical protein